MEGKLLIFTIMSFCTELLVSLWIFTARRAKT
jgi:hypothetical protein